MKLKRYNEYIKESFGLSKEYQDFLKSKAIPTDIFDDSLFDVKQFARVSTYKWLENSKGHVVNTEIDDDNYRMIYTCIIQYTVADGKNDFNKIIDNLNTIKVSIEEMIDRAIDSGLKLKQNIYETSFGHKFEISFTGDNVDLEELKSVYKDYTLFQDKEYLSGISKLKKIYSERGVNIDDPNSNAYIDTVDDENGLILIGILINEELYHVATYDKETKKFSIDYDEIMNSIEEYN